MWPWSREYPFSLYKLSSKLGLVFDYRSWAGSGREYSGTSRILGLDPRSQFKHIYSTATGPGPGGHDGVMNSGNKRELARFKSQICGENEGGAVCDVLAPRYSDSF